MLNNKCSKKVKFSSPEVSTEIARPTISETDKHLLYYSRREIRQFRRQSVFGYVRFAEPLVTLTETIDRVPQWDLSRFYYTSKELKDMVQDFLESSLPSELETSEETCRRTHRLQ